MGESAPPSGNRSVYLIVAYVAVVLLIDALAANRVRWDLDLGAIQWSIEWRNFMWRHDDQFDSFKFVLWLVVPLAFSLGAGLDWGYFGFGRWKKNDLVLLAGLIVLGGLAVGAIAFIPALREYYPSQRGLSWHSKNELLYMQLMWNLSWLPGWEFMHRYFLLSAVQSRWPRFGWLLVPLSEGLYHLQKHWTEMLAMVAASVCFTQWTMRRKNLMLPFIVHAAVELGLAAFRILV
jgi:membrane protease YdiL (CAAX protease family)